MPNADPVRIIRSPRRTRVALRIGSDGVLEVLAPPLISECQLKELVARESALIAGLRSRMIRRPPLDFSEGARFPLLGQLYPLHLTRRLRIFDHAFMVPDGTEEAKKAAMIQLYRELAGTVIRRRVEYFQDICGARPARVNINSASSRWGSCSGLRTLSFSWKSIQLPPEQVDYIVVHELTHLHEMNHSQAFWRKVAQVMPDYAARRTGITAFARTLPRWD